MKRILIVFVFGLGLIQCQLENEITHEIIISTDYELKVPVESTTLLSGLRLFNYNDSIVYTGSNGSICFYDYKQNLFSKDTFLSSLDYLLYEKIPMAIFRDQLVFRDVTSLLVYDLLTHEVQSIDISGSSENSLVNGVSLTSSPAFGSNNRIYSSHIPFVTNLNRKDQFTLYLFDGMHTNPYELNLPPELLSLIYECNRNLFHPYMEPDHLKGGFNISFPLSCRIFHFDMNHEITERKVINPECECEITQHNFVKATAYNFFPATLPIYGSVFSDQYRKLYYQFYSAPTEPGLDRINRINYLRVMDSQYNILATLEVDWNDFRANLLILKEGTYIQSASPPDEKYFYYQELEVIKK